MQVADEVYSAGVPVVQRKLASGTVAQVVTMPPVVRRQIEQWQWATSRSGASTTQLPAMTAAGMVFGHGVLRLELCLSP
jgi:hypothetical protein